MKTVGLRSMLLYLILALFLGCGGYLFFSLLFHGGAWVSQPYNEHLSASLGEIRDRDGELLAYSQGGERFYHEDGEVRRALLHTVGDPYGYIGTSVEFTMRDKLTGYNVITGLNDTFLSDFGKDVNLTLDLDACLTAYEALGSHNGGVLVYNYRTSEILCKVSTPGFDPMDIPEDLEENEEYKGAYLDNTLSGSFTPGSIFKLVTAAAAMEKWPDSWMDRTYECTGSEEIGGSDIACLHGEAHGTQDLFDAMGHSCNVYFARLANEIGAKALQKKAEEMGFNREFSFRSLDLARSEIDLSACNENELGWAGVGQYTVLANPCHMMLLMAAIANGGEFEKPRLTRDIDLLGALENSATGRQLLSPSEAAGLKRLLRSNVEDYYGDWMFPEGMNVCAKTGTGEVGGGKGPNCWMVGFCDSAQYPYAFVVLAEDGAGGMETAGNIAAAVLYALT